jgi:hypothetical protein
MIRQARTYFAGAMSGAALIAIAIAVFAVLVSTQVFGDWPIAGLVGGGKEAAVSTAQPAGEGGAAAGGGTEAAKAQATGGKGGAGGGEGAGRNPQGAEGNAAGPAGNGGGGGETPAGGGGSGGGGSAPAPGGSGGSGGGGAVSGSGGGSGGGGGATSSPSGQVAGTVNETVNGVDEATGGALGETGVTQTTEEVVNGAVGPESPVGKVVDEAAGAVDGIVGGK